MQFLDELSKAVGIEVAELQYVICLLLCYPLALVHRLLLPTTAARHIFSFLFGLGFAAFVFGWDWIHPFISSTVVYLLTRILANNSKMPVIVFVFSLAYLAAGHIYRQYYYYLQYTLDWTVPQMMLTIKLTNFAWNVADGQKPAESFREDQRARRITLDKFPTLLEWYSYVFFFCGFLTGPPPDYNEYIQFTDRSLYNNEPNRRIPWAGRAFLKKVAWVVIAVIMNKAHEQYNERYTITPEYAAQPLWYRILYLYLSVELGFNIYYFAWFNGEAACVLIGLAYHGRDEKGKVRWTRVDMTDLYGFKFATDGQSLAAKWNIAAATWLKRSVHVRLLKLGFPQLVAAATTFMVSAFWHGFYPGYYLFFGTCAFFRVVQDVLYKNVRPLFYTVDSQGKQVGLYPRKYLYDFACWLSLFGILDYATLAFRLMSFERAMTAWSQLYFFPHLLGVLIIIVFKFVPKRGRPTSDKKREPPTARQGEPTIATERQTPKRTMATSDY